MDLSGMADVTTRGWCLSAAIAALDWRWFCAEVAAWRRACAATAIRCDRCGTPLVTVPTVRCPRCSRANVIEAQGGR